MEAETGLVDGFDGQPLPAGTEPVVRTFDSARYTMHVSAENIQKLHEALKPFPRNAVVEGHSGRMSSMRFLDTGETS